MAITLQTAIFELRHAIPSFPIDSQSEEDNLSYLVFNNFARFICSQREVLQYLKPGDDVRRFSEVPLCTEFLERLLDEGDSDVHDLILYTIETLSACPWQQAVKDYAGPRVAAIWNEIHSRRRPK